MTVDRSAVDRFAAALDPLVPAGERLGIAVSGGPDSVALLLLAAAARPGLIEAATVDHRLRPESADEALAVAAICARLAVPHAVLATDWPAPPAANVQALARRARYAALARWATERALAAVTTGHHADDQAETLLMRLARGAGLAGLRGIRPVRPLDEGIALVRPLLGWRKSELGALVAASGLGPIDDPSNRDPRHDRTAIRALLETNERFDPARVAASAAHLGDADDALEWALRALVADRLSRDGAALQLDPTDVPAELVRRLTLAAFAELGAPEPRGPELARALAVLRAGGTATLSGLKLQGGACWRLSPAPPRR